MWCNAKPTLCAQDLLAFASTCGCWPVWSGRRSDYSSHQPGPGGRLSSILTLNYEQRLASASGASTGFRFDNRIQGLPARATSANRDNLRLSNFRTSLRQSRHLMDWVDDETTLFQSPLSADKFVGRETLWRFEPSPEIEGVDEVGKMPFQLRMIVVVEALDGRFLDRSVHSLYLPIGPGVNRPRFAGGCLV